MKILFIVIFTIGAISGVLGFNRTEYPPYKIALAVETVLMIFFIFMISMAKI